MLFRSNITTLPGQKAGWGKMVWEGLYCVFLCGDVCAVFLPAAAVLFLFTGLILRLIVVAERQHTRFARVYGYSVLSIFLFHLFINIGMVLGLTPVIGIPLPFFSYGGSSLWGFTILLFVFLRIDAGRGKR